MPELLKARLDAAFRLTHDLAAHLDESSLGLSLPNLPSNQISGQFWCVVGARESYLKAIEAGSWQGFACSLKTPQNKVHLLAALQETHRQLDGLHFAEFSAAREELAFALLEHEIQHHGQFIRYVYGNRLDFPESWRQRYTV